MARSRQAYFVVRSDSNLEHSDGGHFCLAIRESALTSIEAAVTALLAVKVGNRGLVEVSLAVPVGVEVVYHDGSFDFEAYNERFEDEEDPRVLDEDMYYDGEWFAVDASHAAAHRVGADGENEHQVTLTVDVEDLNVYFSTGQSVKHTGYESLTTPHLALKEIRAALR